MKRGGVSIILSDRGVMCGIVGYTGPQSALPLLLEGLSRLEYRGYDSAGIAVVTPEGRLASAKRAGKLDRLAAQLKRAPLPSRTACGIGHTRWATHGLPNDANAHPHLDCRSRVAVVHNGILENHAELRRELSRRRHRFRSDTDTECLAHLIEEQIPRGGGLLSAVRRALLRVRGTYAVACAFAGEPGTLVAARQGGGGLALGEGRGEAFLASDVPALLPHTRRVLHLEDGECAVLTPESIRVLGTADGKPRRRSFTVVDWDAERAEKGGFPHFMLKEIHEQPRALEDALRGRLDARTGEVHADLSGLGRGFPRRLERVFLLACGTSYYAGLVGKFLFEEVLRLPVEVDVASEFRYRNPVVGPRDLAVVVTQSGETVDTLVALREAKARGARSAAVCNVMGSSATREADAVLLTRAGPEIGVASTKAFTTQLACLHLLALGLAGMRGSLSRRELHRRGLALARAPRLAAEALREAPRIRRLARTYGRASNFLFLGRGVQYPIALEGALKLKEISYLHAEGYPGGEMKHGPIALIDRKLPVVALAPRSSRVYEKTLNNLEEVRSRGGRLLVVAERGDRTAAARAEDTVFVPSSPEEVSPLLTVIPLQLFAYEVARLRGREIDQPRNLAKSVTVE